VNQSLVRIGDICTTTQGGQITKANTSDTAYEGGYRYLYIADFISDKKLSFVDDEHDTKKVTENDLVMANTGSPGRVFKGKDGILSNNLFKISFDLDVIDRDYLYLMLSSSIFQNVLQGQMKGGIQKHLGHATISRQEIPLPYPEDSEKSLKEQKRIAAILDKADGIRRKRKQAIQLADDFLRSVFLDMFGDPVTNPKGWDKTELGSLIEKDDRLNYGVVQPGVHDEEGVPLIRSGDLYDFTPRVESLKHVSKEINLKHRKSILRGNELLIACVGSIGKVGWVSEEMIGWNIARAVTRIPLIKSVNREYIYRYLQSPVVQAYFEKETRAVAQPTLNVSLIAKTPVTLPPESFQKKFLIKYSMVSKYKNCQKEYFLSSNSLFESLSQKAFKGEL